MFNMNYLNKYYSSDYIELKNEEKFLYGKFYRIKNYTRYVLELYFIDKNNELKIRMYYKIPKQDKGSNYLEIINNSKAEAYFYVPLIWEEITLITENKKIQSKKDYFGTEGELYEYLLDLFREDIPKEFFEQRNVKKYKEVYEPDYIDPSKEHN